MAESSAAGASVLCENSSAGESFEEERSARRRGSLDANRSCDSEDAYVNVEVCLGLGGVVVLRHTFTPEATICNLQAELKRVLGKVALQKIGRFVVAQDADASHAGFRNDHKDACKKWFRSAVGSRAHADSIRTGRPVVITAILETPDASLRWIWDGKCRRLGRELGVVQRFGAWTEHRKENDGS